MTTLLQPIQAIMQGILGAPWGDILYVIRLIFGFLDVVFFMLLVWLFSEAYELRPPLFRRYGDSMRVSAFDQKKFKERWSRIMEKALKAPPQSFILAIIEADKCVDDALKELGLEGEHMADRLEKLRTQDYPSLDRLWRAHRVRNELVHTPDFSIDQSDAEDVISIYEKFLKELKALPS